MKPTRIYKLEPYEWTRILLESQEEGHQMVHRLLTDFRAGTNRFDAPGEILLVQLSGSAVVAVAGLNQEPDDSLPRAGRIRRFYVLPGLRGKGIGRALIAGIIASAEPHFEILTVNAGRLPARGFYEHMGFTPVDHPRITHRMELPRQRGKMCP
jgi:GNAT superfamily N-acetyltransferase